MKPCGLFCRNKVSVASGVAHSLPKISAMPRTEPQPVGGAGRKILDQHVRAFDQLEHGFHAGNGFRRIAAALRRTGQRQLLLGFRQLAFQLAAFFGKMRSRGQGISAPISGEVEMWWYDAMAKGVAHPLTDVVMTPKAPDGPEIPYVEGVDPRAHPRARNSVLVYDITRTIPRSGGEGRGWR